MTAWPRPSARFSTARGESAIVQSPTVTVVPTSAHGSPLAQFSGAPLYTSAELLLKSLLDMESEVSLVAGPPVDPLGSLFDRAAEDDARELLHRHSIELAPTPDASRAIALASAHARAGHAAIALVPNIQLDRAMPALARAADEPLADGGGLCLLLVDNPKGSHATSPRTAMSRLGLPCVEPSGLEQLHDTFDISLRLSRAARIACGAVLHITLLRCVETTEARPNRHAASVDEMLLRRKRARPPRVGDGDLLRVARRLELNRQFTMPSPGEREPVGFVTVGPAHPALAHALHVLQLRGRVPVLQLGLIHPPDETALARLLSRCDRVMVLEPRPGEVEAVVLSVAEALRRRQESPASVWGRAVPPGDGASGQAMRSDEDLHPSVLIRKILHLFAALRPIEMLAQRLTPDPEPIDLHTPERGVDFGHVAATTALRGLLAETDRWLRDPTQREEDETRSEPRALVLDEMTARTDPPSVVHAEIWDQWRFEQEGIAALREVAWSDRNTLFVIQASTAEAVDDLERLIRGAVPGSRAARCRIERGQLDQHTALRRLLRDITLADGVCVLIVSESTPSRFDLRAVESSLAEVDRLGFQPRERLTRPSERACELVESGDDRIASPGGVVLQPEIRSSFTLERLPPRLRSQWRFRVRPLIEQIEITRTKPPLTEAFASGTRLTPPTPLHAHQANWRAHLAGYRGQGPGLAASLLCEAGQRMGYSVRCVYDATIIGPGRRSWAQVLFTRSGRTETPIPLSAATPFGEADLLAGLDLGESLRAVGPDPRLRVAWQGRTAAVVNVGSFGEARREVMASEQSVRSAMQTACLDEQLWLDDFAERCRSVFHTDRMTDLAVLGCSFQRGLIPVSLDAMDGALHALESRGYGRAREAFEFGRRLASDVAPGRIVARLRDVGRTAACFERWIRRGRWRGRQRAEQFAQIVRRSLEAMPGLAETDAGRRALRDFVRGTYRCTRWGGLDDAQRLADLLTQLYHADRGDRGRALTRNAVLPLADAMLINDVMYVASMVTSSEQRQRLRQRLNVKHARGDTVERRYLTRIELTGFRRRLRADVRSSDWPARAIASLRRLVPNRLRGSRSERERREFMIDLIVRISASASAEYDHFAHVLSQLNERARAGTLREMSLDELREFSQPRTETGPADESGDRASA